MIGETLDSRYTIVRLLGEGGMGAVYEARHSGTGRRVAVKVITGDLAKQPDLVARFTLEAKAAGSIESQYVAHVTDAGRDDARGLPYLVMEYLAGEDLSHVFRRVSPLPPELAMKIGAQACLGLMKAHELGIVHRDIKPANMLLAERDGGERVVKLLDFGIAKVKMDEAQRAGAVVTRTGNLLGTPLYMSPEQARGHEPIDARADVWSLGVVLYEALTGGTPHQHAGAMGELILRICQIPAPRLQDLAPWVEADVADVVERALAIDRTERHASAAAMFEEIKALLPRGWAIHEADIAAMPEDALAAVASRTRRARPVTTSPAAASNPSSTADATLPALPSDVPPKVESPKTFGATSAPASSSAIASRAPWLVAIGAVAIAAGAFVAVRTVATKSAEHAIGTPSIANAPSALPAAPVQSEAPVVAPDASASAPPAASSASPKATTPRQPPPKPPPAKTSAPAATYDPLAHP